MVNESRSSLSRISSVAEEEESAEEVIEERDVDQEIDAEHPEIPSTSEMGWNFIFTPIIVYTGFGRVAMLYERKNSLLQIAQA